VKEGRWFQEREKATKGCLGQGRRGGLNTEEGGRVQGKVKEGRGKGREGAPRGEGGRGR